MRSNLPKSMESKARQEALVRASGLDWIIKRPGGLTDGPATRVFQAGSYPMPVAGQASRTDDAAFVFRQLVDA